MASVHSPCAHSTVKYSVVSVGWTRETITISDCWVEKCWISVTTMPWNCSWISIKAVVWLSMILFRHCHEVAIILSDPGWWTCRFSRNHDACRSCRDKTDSTWCILLKYLQTHTEFILILCTLNCTSPEWRIEHNFSEWVVRIVRQANYFSSSSSSEEITSTSSSRVNQLCSSRTWTRGWSPPSVSNSSNSSCSW